MASNSITVVGNLTRDPELRFTQSGKPTVTLGIAVNRRYQVNGEWQEQTSYMNVVAWDQLAENVAASLTKGARILVTGRLEIREYEARDGGKRQSVDIVADEVGPTLRWATVHHRAHRSPWWWRGRRILRRSGRVLGSRGRQLLRRRTVLTRTRIRRKD